MKNDGRMADPVFSDPVAVAEHMLEVTRQAYMDRDFEAYRIRFIFPQVVGTFTGDEIIETESNLRVVFDNFCALLDNQGIVDLHRRTLSAEFETADKIQANYVSQYLRPDLSLTDEVYGLATLRLVDGLWRIAGSRYATEANAITRALSFKDPR